MILQVKNVTDGCKDLVKYHLGLRNFHSVKITKSLPVSKAAVKWRR